MGADAKSSTEAAKLLSTATPAVARSPPSELAPMPTSVEQLMNFSSAAMRVDMMGQEDLGGGDPA